MKRLAHLVRDERGTSVIELALVAPVLAALVIGMTDLSRGYSAKLQLEQAAQRSIERTMNGKKQTALFQTLQTEAMQAAGVGAGAVEVRFWLECDGVPQNTAPSTMEEMVEDYKIVCEDGEPQARYVNVRIEKTFTPMFNTRWLGANPNGTYTLVGEAGIRVQ
ncbi:MAG TPA: TadE/TadG family type IV pilus assembly protein [Sphingomicrobium sp.]